MGAVLAVLEQRGGTLKPVSAEVLAASHALAKAREVKLHALVIGPPDTEVDEIVGTGRIYVASSPELELYQAGAYAHLVVELSKSVVYDAIVMGATATGKDLAPRVAAELGATLAADVTGLEYNSAMVVRRPTYAGKVVQTLRIARTPCVISIRPKQFAPQELPTEADVLREDVDPNGTPLPAARTVEIKRPEQAKLDVAEASIVVSGGRGLQDPEKFVLVENLAAALGGAVGASRAVVDAGWRPHAEQVGQTGKTVAPDLYVAVGISGAIQHLAGMRTAKTIVAINKDPDAPIFKVADYGIVGDAFEVVPKLTEAIRALEES
jgi:electron transfer flavoprotein alpha subunit